MENLFVTSEITLNKTAEKRSSPVPTNTEFFSYDQRAVKKTINFQFKGEPLDLSEANVILGFDFVTAGQSVIFESADGSIVIEDPAAGKVNVMLPNDIYAYSGSVIIYVFVEFSNGQSLDYPAFSTEFQESWIDQDLEEMAQFYVKRFEDLRNLVLEQAAGIDRDLTDFENRIDQIESELAAFDIESLSKEIEEEIRTAVEERITDIEKRLEDADFVTEESVDHTLENFILGEPLIRKPTLDFAGKVRLSFVENVNRTGGVLSTSLPSWSGAGTEITQGQYNTISRDDETLAAINSTTSNGRMQVIFSWDILEDMKRRFPNLFLFFSPQTKEDELKIIQRIVTNIQFTVYAFINATTPHPIIGYRRPPANTSTSWEEMATHEATTPEALSFPLELIVSSGNENTTVSLGKALALLRGPDRGTTDQNTIRVRYAKVEYTVEFRLSDLYVPKTIDQMANPTIDMFNHLAQRVNELEMKG
ncbi:BppU family phage baseplate upper protein [Enterococcus casseliflavus]|uniref:BppU family phage baseplate upper protein n=1 Tax=Enterococcus casseliflavus TaxID=37734 RepID=UPI001C8B624D|nr:BppU family phage baseplate upper protein [Enterococcus casseliflavus]MBX9115909.1 BppU family phage baseplate upper protein [Enterococcus casseliflavus]MBX9126362.1 BppU family phage baseplate upper protein [Enterococcus casseliflavus]